MIGLNHPPNAGAVCRRSMSRTAVALAALSLATTVSIGSAEASVTTSATGAQAVPGRVAMGPAHGAPSQGHGEAGLSRAGAHSRRVCSQSGPHCTAQVATDAAGVPLVVKNPVNAVTPAAGADGNTWAYSPQTFSTAYRMPWYSPVRQTIAVIDVFGHPNAKADLDVFNAAWGLGSFPSCSSIVT